MYNYFPKETNNNLKDGNYLYDITSQWDINVINRCVKEARCKNNMPDFVLEVVEIHLTSVCQYDCNYCYGQHLKSDSQFRLNLNTIEKNILSDLRENTFFKDIDPLIVLSGLFSEPLLHPEIKEIIKKLSEFNFRFGIYTNGVALNKEIIKIICQSAAMIKKSKPNYISFNITSSIVNKDYKKLLERILYLIKLRNHLKANLVVNAPILIDTNLVSTEELKLIHEDLLKVGVDKIRYSIPHEPVKLNNYTKADFEELIKELKEKNNDRVCFRYPPKKPFSRCFVMTTDIAISADGAIYPCSQTCTPSMKNLSYGSIIQQKLSEIWRSNDHENMFMNFDPQNVECRCNCANEQFNRICSNYY